MQSEAEKKADSRGDGGPKPNRLGGMSSLWLGTRGDGSGAAVALPERRITGGAVRPKWSAGDFFGGTYRRRGRQSEEGGGVCAQGSL